MAFSLTDIAGACGSGAAKGLKKKLRVAMRADVQAIPEVTADTLKVETDITMVATKVFVAWEFSKLNHNLEISQEGDADSYTIKSEIKCFIPGITPEKTYQFNSIQGCEVIAIATDLQGHLRIIGEVDDGATLNVKEMTNDKNGYEITITWESKDRPYFYTGAIPT